MTEIALYVEKQNKISKQSGISSVRMEEHLPTAPEEHIPISKSVVTALTSDGNDEMVLWPFYYEAQC